MQTTSDQVVAASNILVRGVFASHFKDSSLWKDNKASSGAEDDAKSVEVGTHKVGHWSDLSRGQSSGRVGQLWKTKCDIMLRLV